MANSHGRAFPWTCPRCGAVTVTRLENEREAALICCSCHEPFPEKAPAEAHGRSVSSEGPRREEKHGGLRVS